MPRLLLDSSDSIYKLKWGDKCEQPLNRSNMVGNSPKGMTPRKWHKQLNNSGVLRLCVSPEIGRAMAMLICGLCNTHMPCSQLLKT